MLGFSKSVAEKALDSIIKSGAEDLSVEVLIKTALKSL
jgi:Holliday junction resolvasome RuvABC DNA-binding subunit